MIKKALLTLIFALGLVALPLTASSANAADSNDPTSQISQGTSQIGGGDANTDDLPAQIKNITNVLLFVLGAIAVIVIIIGGIRYTTSNGDPQAIKGAKDTILYAVVGLVVAILAFAIVNWVLGAFAKK